MADDSDLTSLDEKTAIVTGANTGIGKETARELARKGYKVILACRDTHKAEEARTEIVQDTNNDNVLVRKLDLASLASVKEFAELINESERRLDLLVNNAGLVTKSRIETTDGFEMHFGVNHLGHFYLTNLLLDKLKASAPSRIVNVSSDGHRFGKLDFEDLQLKRSFHPATAYGKSKTCNILFTVHLAKLLQGSGVTAYSLHPGVVTTEIGRNFGSCGIGCFYCLMRCLCVGVITSEDGAKTTLHCCLDPALADESGLYYDKCKRKRAKSHATNAETAAKLWEVSCDLCGLTS